MPGLKKFDNEIRLGKIDLTTLEKRRERGDLIQFYKINNGSNKINWFHPVKWIISINTTGIASNIRRHKQRLERQLIRNCEQRRNFFVNHNVPNWNNLSSRTVEAKTTNHFKNRLDSNRT